MNIQGIFINGVYSGVLSDIYQVQRLVPEQLLYLQPYSGQRIVELSDHPPTIDCPVRLFLSLTGGTNKQALLLEGKVASRQIQF